MLMNKRILKPVLHIISSRAKRMAVKRRIDQALLSGNGNAFFKPGKTACSKTQLNIRRRDPRLMLNDNQLLRPAPHFSLYSTFK
jgi:hypothetical protein